MSDRLKYFRIEAAELVERLHAGLMAFERGEGDAAPILRAAHTLKGAARVVGQVDVADAAHALEGAMASPAALDEAFRCVDAIAACVEALSPARTRPDAPPVEGVEAVRVERAALDALIEDLAEASSHLAGLRHQLDALSALQPLAASLAASLPPGDGPDGRARAAAEALGAALRRAGRGLHAGVERAGLEMAAARSRADALRLVPVQRVFTELERTARDAAQLSGKAVAFEAEGGDTRLDGPVLLLVRDALLHIVRNAVAHGVEPAPARRSAGKPATGRVRLRAERRGAHVAFSCSDDGAGLDPAVLRMAADRLGLLAAGEATALSVEEAQALVFRAGLTTAHSATPLAGRGVGLDAAQAIAHQLRGTLAVSSEPGRGTTFTLVVPLSLSAVPSLLLEAGGQAGAVPTEAVTRTARVGPEALGDDGGRRTVALAGREYPFVALAELLGAPAGAEAGAWTVVLLRAGDREAAIGVGRLRGTAELIVRPVPALAGPQPLLSGASLDAEGHPFPVFDAATLVAAAHRPGASGVAPTPARSRPILVVDDSITTRMLEQSILEAAGFEVAVAASGEEALEMAHAREFGLFIVDVEMPGMSGFAFVEATRLDGVLARTPAMLVTSRRGEDDRRRGADAGAQAYMVKSEFDQARFLDTVRQLLA